MAHDIPQLLSIYSAAWNEPDAARRMQFLAACWDETGRYVDPKGAAANRAGLADLIGKLHAQMPGAQVRLTSGASQHHNRIHFTWQLVLPDGRVGIDGVDFGTLSETGQLKEIVGFFGPPPPAAPSSGT